MDQTVKIGEAAKFEISVTSDGEVVYQWFKGSVPLPGQNSKTLEINPVTSLDFGSYHAEVSNGIKTVSSREALLVEELTPPVITWNSGNVAVIEGGSASLRVQVSGSDPISYRWEKDGDTWTFEGDRSMNGAENLRSAEGPDGSYAFWKGSQTFAFGATPLDWASSTGWNSSQLKPLSSQNFTCAASFQGNVIFGTSNGLLQLVERRVDLTLPIETAYPLDSVRFINDEFLAFRPVSGGSSFGPVLISGDGKNWRDGRSFSISSQEYVYPSLFSIGGHYFGTTYVAPQPKGWAPSALAKNTSSEGVSENVYSAAFDDTRWLVIGASKLYSVTPDGETWTPISTVGYSPNQNDQLTYFKGNWFVLRPNGSFNEKLFKSPDGETWASIQGMTGYRLSHFGDKLCTISEPGDSLMTTTDGSTWETTSTVIPPAATGTGANASRVAAFVEFNGSLVMLLKKIYGSKSSLLFSNDGESWLNAPAPDRLQSISIGNGVLTGVTDNGGIILARSNSNPGSAPQVTITSPRHRSAHLSGSAVEIKGAAIDPDGGEVVTDCFVDGQLLATATGPEFQFTLLPSNYDGHIVVVRSRDSSGLVGSDEILVSVTAPELPNSLDSGETRTHIPLVSWTTFGNYIYAAGANSLYRGKDGDDWQRIILPSLPDEITNIVAGNGTLILQTNSSVMVTRDGINWSKIDRLVSGSSGFGGKIQFENGWFVGTSGGSNSATIYSKDGLVWNVGESFPSTSSPTPPVVLTDKVVITSPAHRSLDGGLNWISIPEFAGLNSNQIRFASAYGKVFAGLEDGRIFSSDDLGVTWQLAHTFPSLPTNAFVNLTYRNGRLYWGGAGHWIGTSENGTDWVGLSGEALLSSRIRSLDGRLVGCGHKGMVWSDDGVLWSPATASPANPKRDFLETEGNIFLMGDTSGGLWKSLDGLVWENLLPGIPLPPLNIPQPPTKLSLVEVSGITVAGGSSNGYVNIYYTADSGLVWKYGTFQGGPQPERMTVNGIWSNGTTAFASIRNIAPVEGADQNELWYSHDGKDWFREWSWVHGEIVGMVFHGDRWLALCVNGDIRSSSDQGESWSDDGLNWTESTGGPTFIIPLLTAQDETHFRIRDNAGAIWSTTDGMSWQLAADVEPASLATATARKIVTFGEDLVAAGSSGLMLHSSDDGATWLPGKLDGEAFPSGMQIRDLEATDNALFAIFTVNSNVFPNICRYFRSTNGLNWTELQLPESMPLADVAHSENSWMGILATGGLVKSEDDGATWTDAGGIPGIGSPNSTRLFLFAPGTIKEWTQTDLAISMTEPATGTYGVGDEIVLRVSLRNLGATSSETNPLPFEAWLSSDGFFGDGNDIYVGTSSIQISPPAPGGEVSFDVPFRIPDSILPGNQHVVLKLATDGLLRESNRSNNTVISAAAVIDIPEWEFNVATNGNGQVNRDFSATRYPHKSRVSLTASAGKGASFAGWSGDAFSPNNQVTILMDGDKSVLANFSNRANLRLFIRGNGQVDGLADLGSYAIDSTASLSASPADGWTFSHWSGASSDTSASTNVLMDGGKILTANFQQNLTDWKTHHFTSSELNDPKVSANSADPDGDGVENWKEHLHGSNPKSRVSSGVESLKVDGQFLRCIYTRLTQPGPNGSLKCEATRTLNDWNSPDLEERVINSVDGIDTIEARIPVNQTGRGFFRFKYTPETP